jgi:CIC family chloride channel protein
MSAIFGTPVAGIFLAIELLLFEFSPRSIIPVAIACITGAAGHHFLFESGPVFPAPPIEMPGNMALALYSIMGLIIGVIAALVTKAVYAIEDGFEKLPVHWAFWPAIGGVVVGVVGYFAPHTLGVGYDNITHLLSGNLPLKVVLFLCVLKFISWAIALGSGTSGGTLAPLLTIGGATGVLLGMAVLAVFPNSGIVLPLAALVGMSAMFAGASRALLTSIVFALEASGESNALLPLLGACTASYIISYFLMENTIMTEKIARRGVKAPHSYQADVLDSVSVKDIMPHEPVTISIENSVAEVKDWLNKQKNSTAGSLVVVNNEGELQGLVRVIDVYTAGSNLNAPIESLVNAAELTVLGEISLREAVGLMAKHNVDVLPVTLNGKDRVITGVLTYKDVMGAYQLNLSDFDVYARHISLKRNGIKILLHGRKLLSRFSAAT